MNRVDALAKMIDHSILHPAFTDEDLRKGCEVAAKYKVASVCVKPYMVRQAVEYLKGSGVYCGCVIGFPAGNSTIEVKVFETRKALEDGAVEIDMVINIGKALQGDLDYLSKEIGLITETCHQGGAIVKVILETDYLPSDEIIADLCTLCTKLKVDYVKTSTGYGFVKKENGDYNYQGATLARVRWMRECSGAEVKIKAAGGIRDLDSLLAMRDAGCSRCGATATVSILEEARRRYSPEEI